jgi:hypothetical protein
MFSLQPARPPGLIFMAPDFEKCPDAILMVSGLLPHNFYRRKNPPFERVSSFYIGLSLYA